MKNTNKSEKKKCKNDTIILLHNIRSAYNVGAILRTAEAVGVSLVYMTGYTPIPVDRFNRKRNDVAKTALGSENLVKWKYYKEPYSLIRKLKDLGCEVVGVEQDDASINYKTFKPNKKTVIIMGNEVRGLSKKLRNTCDVLIEIPMSGKKESLNVSVATGVVLFHLFGVSG